MSKPDTFRDAFRDFEGHLSHAIRACWLLRAAAWDIRDRDATYLWAAFEEELVSLRKRARMIAEALTTQRRALTGADDKGVLMTQEGIAP